VPLQGLPLLHGVRMQKLHFEIEALAAAMSISIANARKIGID
jgi:hypothetical protein